MKNLKKYSWSLFALILLCLFLPFVTVKCSNDKLVTMSGAGLIAGSDFDIGGQTMKMSPNALIIGTAVFSAAGLLIVLLVKNDRVRFALAGACDALSTISLIICKFAADSIIKKSSHDIVHFSYKPGAGIVTALCCITAVIMFFFLADTVKNRK